MADISQITLPSGSTYDIKDATAREQIAALSGATLWLGVTTTALTDGATTNPVTIASESVTAKAGSMVSYDGKEFIFNGTAWQELGSTGSLKALAFKDSASGSYTPAGSVAAPVISKKTAGSTSQVTPFGSAGSLPSFSATVANGVLTLGFNAGSLPSGGNAVTVKTGDAEYEANSPAFTGTAGTVNVS